MSRDLRRVQYQTNQLRRRGGGLPQTGTTLRRARTGGTCLTTWRRHRMLQLHTMDWRRNFIVIPSFVIVGVRVVLSGLRLAIHYTCSRLSSSNQAKFSVGYQSRGLKTEYTLPVHLWKWEGLKSEVYQRTSTKWTNRTSITDNGSVETIRSLISLPLFSCYAFRHLVCWSHTYVTDWSQNTT